MLRVVSADGIEPSTYGLRVQGEASVYSSYDSVSFIYPIIVQLFLFGVFISFLSLTNFDRSLSRICPAMVGVLC